MRKDWMAIKAEYVTGKISIRELAEKYHISLSTIGTRAAREDWAEEREKERGKIAASVQERTREKRIKREAAALERITDQAERIIDEVAKSLNDPKQLYRHVIYTKKGIQEEQKLDKMDTRAARDYVAMLLDLKALMADMGGILDKKTAEELKLKRARLNLDRQKAGMEKTDEGETGIALLPAVEKNAESEVVVGDGADENP